MKPKKNPKADLRRRWMLFFQIGLIIVLFTTYQVINWTTSIPAMQVQKVKEPKISEEETPPLIVLKSETPPPLKIEIPDPVDFKIIDDETPEPSETLKSTEAPKKIDIPEYKDITEAKIPDEDIVVPFRLIEDVPIYPGCDDLDDNKERKSCMNSRLGQFINKNFDTSLGEKLGLEGITTVYCSFVVNKYGKLEKIQVRAPHPELQKEAERVINLIPDMKPGKQRGKPVPVSYSIPIRFKVRN
ncbi:energy transducer TonB [Gramella sp. AN32]|uniref:Energy transducer TonB n=1 Tax=Christiangramia antarctica TaxID=2058158 RepID=A0ABW5X954_9FLAO|nr:energy transducer TonB [Gramella sp. AN32]MCM4155319.1 energy transducer TonB [Gramella sp. AN32]